MSLSSDAFAYCDFRRLATRVKRVNDHKAKWAYGSRERFCNPQGLPLPALPATHYVQKTRIAKRGNQSNFNHASRAAKLSLRLDLREYSSEEEAEELEELEEVDELDEATSPEFTMAVPDEDTTSEYQYAGQAILSDAVAKAVEKYESKQTEKIAQEYEMVARERDASVDYLTEDDLELVFLKDSLITGAPGLSAWL